ncbi:MAG: uncharacterized protein KVP18_004181 [Porospora cf. gigantea A]|uniref:uncharacterized protein n=1 Tax=Porospora cf. gigantea A TaxID=2853593 RepID=UPI00355973F0|nr:MAG: hypothetical protein KVP18_004181 [Porospora cf. gigantea A]
MDPEWESLLAEQAQFLADSHFRPAAKLVKVSRETPKAVETPKESKFRQQMQRVKQEIGPVVLDEAVISDVIERNVDDQRIISSTDPGVVILPWRQRAPIHVAEKLNQEAAAHLGAGDLTDAFGMNDRNIAAMSGSEVQSAQKEIEEKLGPRLTEFLRKRHAARTGAHPVHAAEAAPPDSNTLIIDLGNGDRAAVTALERAKLAWCNPLPEFVEASEACVLRDMRFDFEGQRPVGDDPTLHHHGDQPEVPGYTVLELLHLAQSSMPAQQVVALSTLANILRLARETSGGVAAFGFGLERWTYFLFDSLKIQISLTQLLWSTNLTVLKHTVRSLAELLLPTPLTLQEVATSSSDPLVSPLEALEHVARLTGTRPGCWSSEQRSQSGEDDLTVWLQRYKSGTLPASDMIFSDQNSDDAPVDVKMDGLTHPLFAHPVLPVIVALTSGDSSNRRWTALMQSLDGDSERSLLRLLTAMCLASPMAAHLLLTSDVLDILKEVALKLIVGSVSFFRTHKDVPFDTPDALLSAELLGLLSIACEDEAVVQWAVFGDAPIIALCHQSLTDVSCFCVSHACSPIQRAMLLAAEQALKVLTVMAASGHYVEDPYVTVSLLHDYLRKTAEVPQLHHKVVSQILELCTVSVVACKDLQASSVLGFLSPYLKSLTAEPAKSQVLRAIFHLVKACVDVVSRPTAWCSDSWRRLFFTLKACLPTLTLDPLHLEEVLLDSVESGVFDTTCRFLPSTPSSSSVLCGYRLALAVVIMQIEGDVHKVTEARSLPADAQVLQKLSNCRSTVEDFVATCQTNVHAHISMHFAFVRRLCRASTACSDRGCRKAAPYMAPLGGLLLLLSAEDSPAEHRLALANYGTIDLGMPALIEDKNCCSKLLGGRVLVSLDAILALPSQFSRILIMQGPQAHAVALEIHRSCVEEAVPQVLSIPSLWMVAFTNAVEGRVEAHRLRCDLPSHPTANDLQSVAWLFAVRSTSDSFAQLRQWPATLSEGVEEHQADLTLRLCVQFTEAPLEEEGLFLFLLLLMASEQIQLRLVRTFSLLNLLSATVTWELLHRGEPEEQFTRSPNIC